MNQVKKNLKKQLKEMKQEASKRFRQYVINVMEKEGEECIKGFIEDVLNYGCINGTVSALTYTSDIHKVFDKYYYDIEEKIEELKEEWGEIPNRYDLDVKTLYVFIAFEETIREIAEELELDI
jgi:septation ring formation regulator EzrA